MTRIAIPWHCRPNRCILKIRPIIALVALLIVSRSAGFAEDATPKNSPSSVRATHLLGFAGAPNNASGTVSIEADAVQFQKSGKPPVQVKISSIEDVCLGDQSKQVGGLPMTLGKAAVPFGGGRAVSLFAHKKYDTLTLEYVDADGGFHGAIFELKKGQGEALRSELVARGAHVSDTDKDSTQHTAEASSENK